MNIKTIAAVGTALTLLAGAPALAQSTEETTTTTTTTPVEEEDEGFDDWGLLGLLGLAGLVGSGRTSLARTLFGIDPELGGEIRLHGRPVRVNSARDAIAQGIYLVPEDRKREGYF